MPEEMPARRQGVGPTWRAVSEKGERNGPTGNFVSRRVNPLQGDLRKRVGLIDRESDSVWGERNGGAGRAAGVPAGRGCGTGADCGKDSDGLKGSQAARGGSRGFVELFLD